MNLGCILAVIFAWSVVEPSLVLAQGTTPITPTTGVGDLGTKVTPDGNTIKITGGTRLNDGANLFHSFDQFSVGRGDTAQFLNTTPAIGTDNILGRVTGGNPSSIFGTIDTTSYPGANLFLMNPAGIVFGPNATLNVGGSVAFTTADYLRLAGADGSGSGIFHANTATTSLLTSASVSTFGFLSPNPAVIAVQGSRFIVQPGQSISLVGGNITVQSGTLANGTSQSARLSAPGGQIKIASVASPGEVLAENFGQAPNTNGQSLGTLGTVRISKQSHIDTSGEGGGAILVRGGHLIVDDSRISANTKASKSGAGRRLDPSWLGIGIEIEVAQDAIIDNGSVIETNVEAGADHGSGGVRITADHITISGGPKALTFVKMNPDADIPFGIRSNVGPGSTAVKSGDISLNANSSIEIKELGQIETATKSKGNSGHITLMASGDITIDSPTIDSPTFTFVDTFASTGSSGHAGNIMFNSSHGNVTLTNGSQILSYAETNSSGNTGSITVEAPHGDTSLVDTSQIFTSASGAGTLGEIQIKAHNLRLESVSSIGVENTSTGTQKPGETQITLDGRLSLTGGSFINTTARTSLDSADLIIRAAEVFITGKSSGLFNNTRSSGNAGRLHLFTDDLTLTNGGRLFSRSSIGADKTIPSGHGGEISIEGYRNPRTSVVIDGPGSDISSNAEWTGAAGDIFVKASSVTLQNGGTLSATTSGTASSAKGGSITITATDQVTLTDGASITARSTGPADAGTISINAGKQLDVMGTSTTKSLITTEAKLAQGGDIKIQAVDRVRVVDGEISTSVRGGAGSGGNITIDPKVVILQNSEVLAQADRGKGGDILITTPVFVADQSSRIDASTPFGLNGKVTIQSPTSNLSGTVGQLVSKTSPPQVLLQNRCVALAGGEQSTFLLSGRDALPAEPGGWLRSPISMEHWTGEETEPASGLMVRKTESKRLPSIAAHKNDPTILSLRQLTPPGFLVRAFATGSTGCPS